jgi:molybdenum cofactor cytidylyltransferase
MILAVVPAAGQSRRMGVHKQLLPFAGTTVIGHIVDELLRSRIDEVCVVTGHEAELVCQALQGRRVCIVANPDYQQTDMLASIRGGLNAMPAVLRAVLVALGDQPSISARLIDDMIKCLATCGRGIVVPLYAGRRGHPLLLAGQYRDEILAGYDGLGLRGLLAAHADDVYDLPVSTSDVLSDIDYPEDYRRELARFGASGPKLDGTP